MFFSFKKQSILLSVFCLIACSQIAFAGDEPWREITQAELQMKTPRVEADADAEAIFWEVRIDDSSSEGFSMKHYVRVKIFTERGREKYSKFDIPFIKGLKIKDIAARIIKPDGTIVEITDKDIFEREIIKVNKVKVKAKSFAVPNIEPGVIVEYRYREVIADGGAKGMELVFQRDIPVQNLSYYYKPYNKNPPEYQPYNFNDTRFVKDEKGYYLAKRMDVPAFKAEPGMPPEDTVRPWMLLTGAGIEITGATMMGFTYVIKDPSNMSRYWGAVGLERAPLIKWMNKPNKEIKKAATEITASATNDEEKLRKLYEFCQTQIRNSSFDASLTDEDRQKLPKIKELDYILKYKVASGPLIDMLFGAMASSLGFDTRIAFSANRNKMFFDPKMTNESFIHQASIAISVGGRNKFFNPGVSFLPYGMLVWYEEDVWALVLSDKQMGWEKTPLTGIDKTNAKRTGKFKLLEDGTLEGEVRIEHTGQSALSRRMDIYEDSVGKREESFIAEIKERISTAEVSNIMIENVTDASKPLVYQYKIRIPNYAQKTGKRLFFQPGFFEYGEDPMFSTATRKYDIYFRYPWSEEDDIEIEMPKGFTLDNADAPPRVNDPDRISLHEVSIGVDKAANLLKYRRKFYFGNGNNYLFPVNTYSALKSLFDAFHKADTHTITLKQN
jgi:hypothetical protein